MRLRPEFPNDATSGPPPMLMVKLVIALLYRPIEVLLGRLSVIALLIAKEPDTVSDPVNVRTLPESVRNG